MSDLPYSRPLFWILMAFASTAVASISLQNLVWVAITLFLFASIRSRQKIDWPKGLFPITTLLFVASFFLGACLGVDPANSFHTVHKYLAMLMFFPLGAMALQEDQIRKLLLAFLYGAAFCALHGLWNHFWNHQERIDSFSGDKMVFGGMLMVSLLFTLFFLARNPKNPWLWGSLTLIGTALVLTQTRGAWIGFLLGFLFLMWQINRKWLFVGVLFMVALYFVVPESIHQRIKSIIDVRLAVGADHKIENASNERFMIWQAGWAMIQDHPWGVGQGNVEKIYPQYVTGIHYETTVPHLHNDFLQILAQNGWIGLAVYLIWILSYFFNLGTTRIRDPRTAGLNWLFGCVFLSVLAWGMTEYTFSHQFMNIQFFLLGLQSNLWSPSTEVGDTVPSPVPKADHP